MVYLVPRAFSGTRREITGICAILNYDGAPAHVLIGEITVLDESNTLTCTSFPRLLFHPRIICERNE